MKYPISDQISDFLDIRIRFSVFPIRTEPYPTFYYPTISVFDFLMSAHLLVNQEFLFSKKISRFVWVHSELFLSLRCLRKWRDWNWNYFPKSLIFDSMEYQNIKMSRKCQVRTTSSQQEYKSWKKSWEFRDQFQQNDRSTWAQ